MDVHQGQPPVEGRYVVWSLIPSRQTADWCEPAIVTWANGRWHHARPVECWAGPLPLIRTQHLEYDL